MEVWENADYSSQFSAQWVTWCCRHAYSMANRKCLHGMYLCTIKDDICICMTQGKKSFDHYLHPWWASLLCNVPNQLCIYYNDMHTVNVKHLILLHVIMVDSVETVPLLSIKATKSRNNPDRDQR